MCVVSMVHDHFKPQIPIDWLPMPVQPAAPMPLYFGPTNEALAAEVKRLGEVIADFKKALEAAKIVDTLTGQPDCVDPEKEKLQERVAELEAKLDAARHSLG